jgi:hypothetical protein
MNNSLAILVLFISSTTFAANFFDRFIGEYQVVSQICYRNGSIEDNCAQLSSVRVAYDSSNVLRIYEYFRNGNAGYPLEEMNIEGEHGFTRATITGDESSGRWTKTERIRQYAGDEQTELDELRELSLNSDNKIEYTFYHREKAPLTLQRSIQRNYELKKK